MEKISFFLEKFKSLGLGDVLVKKIFIEEVEKVLHVTLESKDVSLKDGILHVKAHPILKSELYMRKEAFVGALSKALGSVKIIGLR